MQKLTLSADESIVRKAKKLAEEEDTSVSAMFDRFLRLLLARRAKAPTIGPIAMKATGVITLPSGKQGGEILEEALAEKYGLKQ